ncbi:MAG: single-stranded DNA-binding protein [Actinobacteria bacterium]|nr:MAG: single-stranded DNA-binding protein [Actinomycetota bacterium]
MNSVALSGTLTEDPELHEDGAEPVRCRMRLAVPRHARGGQHEPGVVYVAVTTFGLEALDCAERLCRGDRIGVTGRIEQDKHRTSEGWRVDHSVLIGQLDLPPETKKDEEEQ